MADDPFTTGMERFTRSLAMPWRFLPRSASEAMLEGFRQGNVLLDVLFYDVGAITRDEAQDLAPWKAGEASILIVPPSGGGRISVVASIDDYVAAGGEAIDTLTIAGVGSSALGTAAFARNVADAVGHPVAAVVSGYGLADLATEAASGFSWFAGLAAIHGFWERVDQSFDWFRAATGSALGETPTPVHHGLDADTVLALLRDTRLRFGLIVAHSKGNMVVGDALHALQREDRVRSDHIGETVHVVSISSRLRMPRSCRQVTEIVGRWDLIGDFATRRDAPADVVVPDAWHHTNTDLYGHIPVTRVLKEVLGAGEKDGAGP